jgi:putative flavoprotein involved in K+ transport
MTRTHTVVVGAGQAGLAMSRCLSDRGIEHVVLERGRVAERWRSERWESLRLLTPNWLSRLPGFRYEGPDPDGFMTMPEVIGFFERYAASFSAPMEADTAVTSIARVPGGYQVETSRGAWTARNVVVATGHCDVPHVPRLADRVSPDLTQLVPSQYRRPDQLPHGGVLVVGASASGVQLADELNRAGRRVTIAAGHHTRVPRRYRGHDLMWWLDRAGILDQTERDVYDVDLARDQPSFQLVGDPDGRSVDLGQLQRSGVQVVGRLVAAEGHHVVFDDDLVATTAAADVKLASLLARLDAWAASRPPTAWAEPEPFQPIWTAFTDAPTRLDLRAAGVSTVIWATGYGRRYPWLHVPVLDARGEIRHHGGITPEPGLYVIGLHFLRRRKSSFIDGVADDAAFLAAHVDGNRNRRLGAIA